MARLPACRATGALGLALPLRFATLVHELPNAREQRGGSGQRHAEKGRAEQPYEDGGGCGGKRGGNDRLPRRVPAATRRINPLRFSLHGVDASFE